MIFLDTGAFIARYMKNDQYHDQSISIWSQIRNDGKICATSNFVLDETFTLLGRRAGNSFAYDRAVIIYSSTSLNIFRPDRSDELSALKLFKKFGDQTISFTDCISFVLMKKYKMQSAFTFDKHFSLAGFQIISRKTGT